MFLVSQVEIPSGRGKPPMVVDKDESLAKVIPQSGKYVGWFCLLQIQKEWFAVSK
jgi:hypothetical protein